MQEGEHRTIAVLHTFETVSRLSVVGCPSIGGMTGTDQNVATSLR